MRRLVRTNDHGAQANGFGFGEPAGNPVTMALDGAREFTHIAKSAIVGEILLIQAINVIELSPVLLAENAITGRNDGAVGADAQNTKRLASTLRPVKPSEPHLANETDARDQNDTERNTRQRSTDFVTDPRLPSTARENDVTTTLVGSPRVSRTIRSGADGIESRNNCGDSILLHEGTRIRFGELRSMKLAHQCILDQNMPNHARAFCKPHHLLAQTFANRRIRDDPAFGPTAPVGGRRKGVDIRRNKPASTSFGPTTPLALNGNKGAVTALGDAINAVVSSTTVFSKMLGTGRPISPRPRRTEIPRPKSRSKGQDEVLQPLAVTSIVPMGPNDIEIYFKRRGRGRLGSHGMVSEWVGGVGG